MEFDWDVRTYSNYKKITYEIDTNGCYVCTSHKINKNQPYPVVKRNAKRWPLSRLIFTKINGEIPKGLVIRHTCDNPFCINPNHLLLGTQFDNVQDRKNRNRNGDKKGVNNGRSKLNEAEIQEIRNDNILSASKLAKKYNVARQTIWRIKTKDLWKHVL